MNKLYFDGSSSPKKKDKSGWGFVLYLTSGERLTGSGSGNPDSTNNEMEYQALIEGLKFALVKEVTSLTVIGDSQVIIYQMTGKYRVKKEELKALNREAQTLVKRFSDIKFDWQRREFNEADEHSRT